MRAAFILFGLLLASVPLEAAEPYLLRPLSPGARPLGMGGAFVTTVDDHDLFFFNPASVSRVPENMITINFPFGLNDNVVEFSETFWDKRKKYENAGNLSEDEQNELFDDLIDKIGDERSRMRVGLPVSFLQKGFGFGIFPGSAIDCVVSEGASSIPTIEMSAFADLLFIVSYGISWERINSLLPNLFSVGVSIKHLRRNLLLKNKSVTTFSSDEEFKFLTASNTGLDIGFLYDLSSHLTVGFAVYDLYATDMKWGNGVDDPFVPITNGDVSRISTTLRLGLSYIPHGKLIPDWVREPRFVFDWGRINEEDMTFFKQIFLGAECSLWRDWFKTRMGFFQGYPTVGFGIGPLRYAYYSEELGHFAGQESDYAHLFEFRVTL